MAQPEQQQITGTLVSDDSDRRALVAQAAPSLEQSPVDGLAGTKESPGVLASAKAGFLRYAPTAQGLLAAAAGDAGGSLPDAYDPTFDYAEYWAANKADYADLEAHYMAGHFDEVRSQAGWTRRAFMLRENDQLDKDIAAGGTVGMVAGMGASLFDVTNLMGVGVAMTGARAATRLGRVGQGLRIGAAEGALSAGIMQELDVTQDWKDAVLDIGVGSLAGGTLMSFTRNLPPDSPLLPGHPQNPAHPDNIRGDDPIHVVKPGGTEAEGTVIHSSGGAAAVTPETRARLAAQDADSLPAKGTGIIGGSFQSVVDAGASLANKIGSLGNGTVFDRMPHYPAYLRGLLTQGLDQFGFLNRAMARGDAAAPEAEAINNVWRQKGRGLQEELKGFLREAQTALGESKLAARMRGAVDDLTNGKVQMNRITREEFFAEAVAHMRAKATNNVNAEAEIKQRLSLPGRSPEQVDVIYSKVLKAAEASTKHMDTMIRQGVDKGMVDPKILEQDYGLPIMFVRGEIMRNRSKFENIVMRLLEKQPQEEWLKDSGWVREKVEADAATGRAAVEARTWDDIQVDPTLYNQVLREWNGELEHNLREQAAAAWTDAETRMARSLDEVDAMTQGLKLATNEKKVKTVLAAKTRAREMEAGWQARNLGYAKGRADRAEARLLQLGRDYPDLLDLGEYATRRFEATGPEIDEALEAGMAAKARKTEADGLVDFLRDERSGPKDPVTGKRPGAMMPGSPEYVAAMAKIDEALQARTVANAQLAEAEAALTVAASKQRNAARFRDSVIKEVEQFRKDKHATDTNEGIVEMLEIQRQRLDELHAKVSEARRAQQDAIQVWKETRTGLGIGRKELRKAKAQFRKTGRLVEKLGKRTPKAEYAEKLARSLSGLDHYPGGMLMDEAPEIGRLKERRFKWNEELLREAQESGMVESDLSYMMDRYTRDMGGRLALHDAYGGQTYSTLAAKVDEDLRKWVEQVPEGHPERSARTAMHEKGLNDFKYMWDRNAGRMAVEPTDMASFAVKTLMNGAYIRIAGGIWKAAVQDVGTAIFSNPRFVTQVLTNGRAYGKLLKEIEERTLNDADGRLEGLRQLKVLMASMENAAHTGVSQRAIGRGSALDQFGIGDGITRTMTRELEVGMQNVGDKVTWATGLNLISDFVRRTAAFAHIADMAAFSKKPWGDLSKSRKAQLASMNIGEVEHRRLGELMKKHGRKHGDLFEPGVDQWDDPRMVELFENSVIKAQNRAAYTESMGAVPTHLHDGSIYLKALGQFQSHAFMSLRFFIQAAAQRGAVTGDYYSGMAAFATSIALGTSMSMLRAFENGKLEEKLDSWEKNPSTLAREMVDRSGILGAASPYFDMATKTGLGAHINNMVGTKFFDPGTKFSQNSALTSALGPAFGEAQTIYDAVSSTVNGKFDKAGQKLLRLLPFNQQLRFLNEVDNSLNN